MKLGLDCLKNWLLAGTVILILCFVTYTVYKTSNNDQNNFVQFSTNGIEYTNISYVASEIRKTGFRIIKIDYENEQVIFFK